MQINPRSPSLLSCLIPNYPLSNRSTNTKELNPTKQWVLVFVSINMRADEKLKMWKHQVSTRVLRGNLGINLAVARMDGKRKWTYLSEIETTGAKESQRETKMGRDSPWEKLWLFALADGDDDACVLLQELEKRKKGGETDLVNMNNKYHLCIFPTFALLLIFNYKIITWAE